MNQISLRCLQRTLRPARGLASALGLLLLMSCGGGKSAGDGTGALGADGQPRLRALAATTSLAVALPQSPDPLLQGLTIPVDAPTKGMWSATQPWPENGLHATLLPTGKVLTYGTTQYADEQNGRNYDLWTPSLGFGPASHITSFDATRYDSFCSTAAYLPDGRLMISGGNANLGSSLITPTSFDVAKDTATLADQRWYATMLTLPDGRPIVVGGMDPYQEGMKDAPDAAIANGIVSMTPELYTPGVGWRTLTGAKSRDAFGPDYLRASFPHTWVAPNGLLFGISAETMWSLDPNAASGAGVLTALGKFKGPASTTLPVNVGTLSSAVMFAPGKVLQVGGNGYFNGDGLPASNMATIVDINGASPVLTETTPMSYARRFPNTVVLPNGNVLVTGGTQMANNGGTDAVYAAEIWNPATGTWTVGASAAQIRVYHAISLLLPNGTVLTEGGGAPGPVNNKNAEVYYPPYLFTTVNGVAQLATRPVMSGISALAFNHGDSAQVEMTTSAPIARVVLLGNSTVTHSFNTTQRFIPLTYTQNGDQLSVALPSSPNLAPPGYYQIVALDANGVPSTGVIVSLGMKGPVKPSLQRGAPQAFDSVAQPGNSIGLDSGGLGVLQASSTTSTPTTAQFLVHDGLADVNCVSLEPVSNPGQWLRASNLRLVVAASDGTDAFKSDATFCPEAGLAGSGVTLRSNTLPGSVLRVRSNQIWLDPQTSDAAFTSSASFMPRNAQVSTLPTIGSVAAPAVASGGTASWTPGLDAAGLQFSWSFGDGSAATAYSSSSAASHAYTTPGLYTVTLTVRGSDGSTSSKTFFQAVYGTPSPYKPRSSTPVLIEPRTGASERLWVVNPDDSSVSVFDTATNARVAKIAVGSLPRTLALSKDGSGVWVTNSASSSISIISTSSLAVTRTVAMPRASVPWGIVIAPGGAPFVTLEATGQLVKLNGGSGAIESTVAVGSNARHLSVTSDSGRVLVSRFITPPLPGENTATVDTSTAGGQVVVVDTPTMTVRSTIVLRHSDKTDTEISGSGVPNYLGPAVISPDGTTAWVPSKQDNIKRGALRNGLALNFQNTVRAISSRIDLGALTETLASRVDHDNASVASAAAYDPTGAYLFVALETARQVEVIDAIGGKVLFRIEAGLAPQGVVVSGDGTRLFVHNFMDRTINDVDISPLTRNGELRSVPRAVLNSLDTDPLPANVLKGKQLFYDARDTRLARDSYMSCATCHNDGGHDGRVWDLTSQGEGLRNTIPLKGRAGMGQGFLHWSANFDEVQDFEGQIRTLSGGTGLLTDAQFNTGTVSQPLGDKKAGLSSDLDALAAYLGSLGTFAPTPNRGADGSLSASAQAGQAVFQAQGCASCHAGAGFTASSDASQLKNIGTLKPASGNRLGGALTGIDIPTLRDVWATAPYLHDGSAPTVADAVRAHTNLRLSAADVAAVSDYVLQIGTEEPAPPAASPAAVPTYVACAGEGATCSLPAGTTATVYYGANGYYASKTGVTGSLTCGVATFGGDPLPNVVKSCAYVAASTSTGSSAGPVTGGLTAQYFGNFTLAGPPVLVRTEAPYFDWGSAAPAASVPADFSARWSGWLIPSVTGTTTLQTLSDDGVRVWVGGQLVIDNWTPHGVTADTATVSLTAGQPVPIQIESFDSGGAAITKLSWQPPGASGFVPVPASALAPLSVTPSVKNLALGKPTTQTSTYPGGAAAQAVDGNTNGSFAGNSVTHTLDSAAQDWWQVDLGTLSRIDVVQLWNRTDCCADRLQSFAVFVSPTDMTGRTYDQLKADPTVTVREVGPTSWGEPTIGVPVGGAGRFVRVQLQGSNNLSLAEVQVWGDTTTELARGKAATQSSSYPGNSPALAVDGNTNGNGLAGSVTATNNAAPQDWWQVDLGQPGAIDSIVLWNRTDCCTNRLQNFAVFVSPTDMTGQTYDQLRANPAVLTLNVGAINIAPSMTLPVGGFQGRYVRVQLAGQNYLSLAEVQVWGTASTSVELAKGKTATQSSSYPGNAAFLAVDGNTNGDGRAGSVTATNNAAPQDWWQVDLGQSRRVDNVVLWNRTDCCSDRLQNFSVFISPTDMTGQTYDQLRANPAVKTLTVGAINIAPSLTLAVGGFQGRYVRVQLAGQNYLSLAEVQVFGQ
jgi:YVTN family beta-propeller protein